MLQSHQAKANEDQVGHRKFINYPNINGTPHFCLKLLSDAKQSLKYRWPYCTFKLFFRLQESKFWIRILFYIRLLIPKIFKRNLKQSIKFLFQL